MTANAPAKINLTLDVLGRRSDGYHELSSLVIGVGLCDHIRCRVSDDSGLRLHCTDPALMGDDNLAGRAARKLAEHVSRDPGLRIELEKVIPVGGGLGGGSSDAATTLRLCNELWEAGLDRRELAVIGAEVGSDVPLFFSLPSTVMTGRGEHVRPVAMRWSGWVLLVKVDERVSTSAVYHAWRPGEATDLPRAADDAIIHARNVEEILPLLSNHLEPAVFRVSPRVARLYTELNRAGLGPMRVSGAGSTLYRLFDEKEAACRTARTIESGSTAGQTGVTTSVVAAPVGLGSIVSEEY